MFEAVGEAYWDTYFDTLRRSLNPGGRASLQVITIDEGRFERYRRRADFIQKYIFPGGMLPSVEAFCRHAHANRLAIERLDLFGLDYARTLRRWDTSVAARSGEILAQGFDQRFINMWRYYLAYCEAGFRSGRIDLMQVTLTGQ
jgi:cyclopropane-fatty-acyl-phospholipid synthase